MAANNELPIHDMHKRHPGLTERIAASNAEALRVCLDRHHRSPINFELRSDADTLSATANWIPTDRRTAYAWDNEIDTTEAGAYTCVLAAVELAEDLVAVRRAQTQTGADYYVAKAGESYDDLETFQRLEISGLDNSTPAGIHHRLRQKRDQAAAGRSPLPALAGVVGFRQRLILLSRVDDAPPDQALD